MNAKDETIDRLSKVLADSYTVYLKTQNFHWNVKGPMFHSLHVLFEEQYTELATAIDEIAERIRSLGAKSPGSFSTYLSLTSIPESSGGEDANTMIQALASDQETIVKTIMAAHQSAAELEDEVTVDLMVQRASVHEKARWMLESLLA